MNDNFYKKIIDESPTGYALHKIICDEKGSPCDYEFLEVNASFETLTGLKGSDIVGKRVTEIIPEIIPNMGKDQLDWINLCGSIALSGGKRELERFWEYLQRWFKITIYSPEKYYFVTHLVDINRQKNQLTEIERLIEVSQGFSEIEEQKIADDFLKICGAQYAVFNLYIENENKYITMAISADKGVLKKASLILGYKIEGRKWDPNSVIEERLKSTTITHFQSLRELIGGIIPVSLVALLEKALNIGEVTIINIVRKNVRVGNFAIFMKHGDRYDKNTLAEIYATQLGMLITRKWAEDKLLHERNLTEAIFHSAPGLIYLYDEQGRLVRWNNKFQKIMGCSSEELSNMSLWDCFEWDRKSMEIFRASNARAIKEGFGDGEIDLQKQDGTTVSLYFTISVLNLKGSQYFAGIAIDITERKKKEEEISYLSYHDHLTGLYNRRFYEEELKRLDTKRNLPLTVVICDVNGLKLINDSFGHITGDELLRKVAEVISMGCRVDDIIARLGGDEFAIILPNMDSSETEKIIKRIKNLASKEKVGAIDISVSFGYETKINEEEKIQEIFKNAEDKMYKKKLFERPSMRGKTIKAIIKTLHEKNSREEQHSHRVSTLCKSMGEALGLPDYEIEELKSVGLLHDIGKIAIEENILNKPGLLTEEEWKKLESHPEIGYRILSTVNDMSDLAYYVLYHHERWDGKGYPKGLRDVEIPFVSRIISIADAYDAMTSERSYRNALPEEYAIQELKINAGLQFDPELVRVFIEQVLMDSRLEESGGRNL